MQTSSSFAFLAAALLLVSALPLQASSAPSSSPQPFRVRVALELAQPPSQERVPPFGQPRLPAPRVVVPPNLQARLNAARPTVVCGMTVIPADPRIDPKFLVEAPPGGPVYTMRVLPVPLCGGAPESRVPQPVPRLQRP